MGARIWETAVWEVVGNHAETENGFAKFWWYFSENTWFLGNLVVVSWWGGNRKIIDTSDC